MLQQRDSSEGGAIPRHSQAISLPNTPEVPILLPTSLLPVIIDQVPVVEGREEGKREDFIEEVVETEGRTF